MWLPQCHCISYLSISTGVPCPRCTLCEVTLKCCHSNTQATLYITPASPHIFPLTTSTHPPTIHPPTYLYLQCKCFPHPILQSTSVSPQYSGLVCIYREMMSYQQALCVGLQELPHILTTLCVSVYSPQYKVSLVQYREMMSYQQAL